VPEKEARRIFQQMIVAIQYCHRLGIANRDVKVRACPSPAPLSLLPVLRLSDWQVSSRLSILHCAALNADDQSQWLVLAACACSWTMCTSC
jgi:serine/threonine protein kinase